jgi:hypothetical protein
VVTDPVPRAVGLKRQYEASDARLTLDLPPPEVLQAAALALQESLATEDPAGVKKAGDRLLALLSEFYQTSRPTLSVLGVRPHKVIEGQLSYELFGDYTFNTEKIRVWMRTAIQGKVTSYRGLLNTMLHEFCHHLDIRQLGFPNTPHTRGFFSRIDGLYHLALDTPPEKRKPLVWIPSGKGWRIDWRKLR